MFFWKPIRQKNVKYWLNNTSCHCMSANVAEICFTSSLRPYLVVFLVHRFASRNTQILWRPGLHLGSQCRAHDAPSDPAPLDALGVSLFGASNFGPHKKVWPSLWPPHLKFHRAATDQAI